MQTYRCPHCGLEVETLPKSAVWHGCDEAKRTVLLEETEDDDDDTMTP